MNPRLRIILTLLLLPSRSLREHCYIISRYQIDGTSAQIWQTVKERSVVQAPLNGRPLRPTLVIDQKATVRGGATRFP